MEAGTKYLIRTALEGIQAQLNRAFPGVDATGEDVVVSNLADNTGAMTPGTENRLVMCLTNIQHETAVGTYNHAKPVVDDLFSVSATPIYINLSVLFYANFSGENYAQGLSAVSRTISFFQQTPFFNSDNMPELDGVVDKLTLELISLDLEGLGHLMNLLGVKYLPSVYYKIRMLTFDNNAIGQGSAMRGRRTPSDPAPQ